MTDYRIIFFAVLSYAIAAGLMFIPPFRRKFDSLCFFQDGDRTARYAALDTLRGFAALLVLLMHYYLWSTPALAELGPTGFVAGGQKAVGVFFVLSSFLMWSSLRLDRLNAYAVSRLLRIYPLHMAVTFLFFWTNNGAGLQHVPAFLAEAALLNIFTNDFWMFNGVAWSIVFEMQFYLLLPGFKYAYGKAPRTFAASMVALLVAALYVELAHVDVELFGARESHVVWVKFFIVGTLFAIVADKLASFKVVWAHHGGVVCTIAGAALLTLDFYGARPLGDLLGFPRPQTFTLELALSVCLLILGLRMSPGLGRWLACKPIRFLGVISYSLYLSQLLLIGGLLPLIKGSHYPLADLFLVVVPCHIGLSALLFLLVERPFLLLARRYKRGGRSAPAEEPLFQRDLPPVRNC